ncbi:MAG: type II toxin-antitoxin system HipA family toxin [Solirubrobacterales bacterium]
MSELSVYLAGRRAGRLIRKENGNLQFRYDPGYDGPALSQALPVQPAAHPNRLCRAVFGGLLLEGDARLAVARNLGVSSGNDYALLEALGGDCAGAITVLEPGQELPESPATRALDAQGLDVALRELPQRPLAADPAEGTRLSLAGAQAKLPVIIEDGKVSLPLNAAAATTHILKPEPVRFPGLVDNEAFCMGLASAVGLPVATVQKRACISGLPYLLVERYDRNLTSDPIGRLHQEDFCQALGKSSEHKYQADGGPTIADSVNLLRECSVRPAQDLIAFWRALVFNWLIGNCDAHAKNFSLLYDASVPALAPLYDLVSTTAYTELTERLAMSVDGARMIGEVRLEAWVELAREIDYSERFVVAETSALVARTLDEAAKLMSAPDHRGETVRKIVEGIDRRAQAFAAS